MIFLYYNTKQVSNIITYGANTNEILKKFFSYYPNSRIKIINIGLFLKMIYGQDLKKYGSNPTYYNIKILC